jgi:hypothetical protein
MATFGTNTTLDTLAASQQTIAQFGEDRAWDAVQAGFDAQNNLMRQALLGLVEGTSDRQRRYGGTDNMSFGLLDQYGTPDAQKVTAGVTIGVPLYNLGRSLQWTYTGFQRMTGAQMAAQTTALMTGDRLAVRDGYARQHHGLRGGRSRAPAAQQSPHRRVRQLVR